ncbi:MAG: hypothetical protein M1839_002486 [Geoglossum umbratile]|nr:MAG: hypothetical protein M1839_002486 [Geoglossum umbratile]
MYSSPQFQWPPQRKDTDLSLNPYNAADTTKKALYRVQIRAGSEHNVTTTSSSPQSAERSPSPTKQVGKPRYPARERVEALKILHTRRNIPEDEGKETVTLTTLECDRKAGEQDGEAEYIRWTHLKADVMEFGDFEVGFFCPHHDSAFVGQHPCLRVSLGAQGVRKVEVSLAFRLIRKIRETREKEFIHGRYLEPTAVRYDGYDPGTDKHDGSVTFFCLPYFSLHNTSPYCSHESGAAHPARTLLQSYFRLESMEGRDALQAVRKLHLWPEEKLVHVPQVWGLILNKSTIVTCSHVSREEMCGSAIRQEPQKALSGGGGPSVVKFTDASGRVFFFPTEQCRSWFAMTDKICQACLDPRKLRERFEFLRAYEFFTRDDVLVIDKDWPDLISRENTGWVILTMRLKGSIPPPSQPNIQRLRELIKVAFRGESTALQNSIRQGNYILRDSNMAWGEPMDFEARLSDLKPGRTLQMALRCNPAEISLPDINDTELALLCESPLQGTVSATDPPPPPEFTFGHRHNGRENLFFIPPTKSELVLPDYIDDEDYQPWESTFGSSADISENNQQSISGWNSHGERSRLATANDENLRLSKLENLRFPLKPEAIRSNNDKVIAVIGSRGAGKLSFISQLTGQLINPLVDVDVDDISCNFFGHHVTLIYTLNSDDSENIDTEIPYLLGAWLNAVYREKMTLAGIIYLYPITDLRVEYATFYALKHLQSLCRPGAYPNTIVATTMWDRLDPKAADLREAELCGPAAYRNRLLLSRFRSRIERYQNTSQSALALINGLVENRFGDDDAGEDPHHRAHFDNQYPPEAPSYKGHDGNVLETVSFEDYSEIGNSSIRSYNSGTSVLAVRNANQDNQRVPVSATIPGISNGANIKERTLNVPGLHGTSMEEYHFEDGPNDYGHESGYNSTAKHSSDNRGISGAGKRVTFSTKNATVYQWEGLLPSNEASSPKRQHVRPELKPIMSKSRYSGQGHHSSLKRPNGNQIEGDTQSHQFGAKGKRAVYSNTMTEPWKSQAAMVETYSSDLNKTLPNTRRVANTSSRTPRRRSSLPRTAIKERDGPFRQQSSFIPMPGPTPYDVPRASFNPNWAVTPYYPPAFSTPSAFSSVPYNPVSLESMPPTPPPQVSSETLPEGMQVISNKPKAQSEIYYRLNSKHPLLTIESPDLAGGQVGVSDPSSSRSAKGQWQERKGSDGDVPKIVDRQAPRPRNPSQSTQNAHVLPVLLWPTEDSTLLNGGTTGEPTENGKDCGSPTLSNALENISMSMSLSLDMDEHRMRTLLEDVHYHLLRSAKSAWRLKNPGGTVWQCEKEIYKDTPPSTLEQILSNIRLKHHQDSTTVGLKLKKRVIVQAQEILGFFVPACYKHPTVQKFWGAISKLIEASQQASEHHSLIAVSQEITAGVAGPDSKTSRFRIPQALVDAFARIVMLFVLGAHAVDSPDIHNGWLNCQAQVGSHVGECNDLMRKGSYHLISMTHTYDFAGANLHEAIGVGGILSLVIESLLSDRSTDEDSGAKFSVVEAYKLYTAKLQIEVQDRPSKRILQKLNYLSEELSIIRTTLHEQLDVLNTCRGLFDFEGGMSPIRPGGQTFEGRVSQRSIGLVKRRIEDIRELESRASVLATQTVNLVELQQENNGKVILVFTVVTTVFLPLSFVTSLLGMNTYDIRNMARGQTLFWEIALPLTLTIMGIGTLVAFQGDRIGRYLGRVRKRRRGARREYEMMGRDGRWKKGKDD